MCSLPPADPKRTPAHQRGTTTHFLHTRPFESRLKARFQSCLPVFMSTSHCCTGQGPGLRSGGGVGGRTQSRHPGLGDIRHQPHPFQLKGFVLGLSSEQVHCAVSSPAAAALLLRPSHGSSVQVREQNHGQLPALPAHGLRAPQPSPAQPSRIPHV